MKPSIDCNFSGMGCGFDYKEGELLLDLPRSGLLEPANEPDKQPRVRFFRFLPEVLCRGCLRVIRAVVRPGQVIWLSHSFPFLAEGRRRLFRSGAWQVRVLKFPASGEEVISTRWACGSLRHCRPAFHNKPLKRTAQPRPPLLGQVDSRRRLVHSYAVAQGSRIICRLGFGG